jgi:hypothetical protein
MRAATVNKNMSEFLWELLSKEFDKDKEQK